MLAVIEILVLTSLTIIIIDELRIIFSSPATVYNYNELV